MASRNDNRPGWAFVVPNDIAADGIIDNFVLPLCRQLAQNSKFNPLVLLLDDAVDQPVLAEKPDYIKIRLKLASPLSGKRNALYSTLKYRSKRRHAFAILEELFTQHRIQVVNPVNASEHYFIFSDYHRQPDVSYRLIHSITGADAITINLSGLIRARLWRDYFSSVDCLVANSQGLLDALIKQLAGVAVSKTVIYPGIDQFWLDGASANDSDQHRESLDKGQRRYILSVTPFDRDCQFETLINAFAIVHQTKPELHLMLVGGSGPNCDQVNAKAIEQGIQQQVHILSDASSELLASYYKNAMLYVCPSCCPGISVHLLEAGANGLPVVAGITSGAAEIIQAGQSGILLDMNNTAALSDEILNLCNDAVQRRLLGAKLKAHIGEHFRWETAAQQYVKLSENTVKST